MPIADSLKAKRDFTNAEKELATYILANPERVVEMKIDELANAAFVSRTTVVRLCRKIGFPGYRDFRIGLAKEIERRRSFPEGDAQIDVPFNEGESAREVMRGIAAISTDAVNSCYSDVRSGSLELAAQLICRAKRVFLFAAGDSYISCEAFLNLLAKLNITCLMGSQFGENLTGARLLRKDDVAVVVSYSGLMFKGAEGLLQAIVDSGCKVVLITGNPELADPAYHIACPVVFAHKESTESRMATFYSEACIRYLLNCIYGIVFSMNYQQNADLRKRVGY